MGFRPAHGEYSHLVHCNFDSHTTSFIVFSYSLSFSLSLSLSLFPPSRSSLKLRNLAIGTDQKCFIELATPKLTREQIEAIEVCCNECIRQRIPVRANWFHADSAELKQITKLRTRVVKDVPGQVRVVDIEGE